MDSQPISSGRHGMSHRECVETEEVRKNVRYRAPP